MVGAERVNQCRQVIVPLINAQVNFAVSAFVTCIVVSQMRDYFLVVYLPLFFYKKRMYLIIRSSFVFGIWTVRQKAKELVEFVQDDDRVREERRKAKKTKDKYIGMAGESVSREYSM